MSPRYYDLSEQVVPGQGAEAITDTPGKEEPSATTEGVRNEPKETDPTSLDSNPANEDETRSPDERTDVTNLASRRARAKKSTPVPNLSTDDFSNILKNIDRVASANPTADFGKVVVSGVRAYSYRANKNALNILAAVVPTLLRSGNFDASDRNALTTLNKQIVAQRRQADDPMSSGAPSPGSPDGAGAPPADPAMAGGAPPVGAPPADPMAGTPAPTGAPPVDPLAGGAAPMGDPAAGAAAIGDPSAGADLSGGFGGGMDKPDAGMGVAPPPPGLAAPADPTQLQASRRGIRRGRSVIAATDDDPSAAAPPAPSAGPEGAGGPLHFDTGGAPNPVQVQHQQDNGDGTSHIINEMGQPEAVNNDDLYHDHTMTQPVTKPKQDEPPAPDAAPKPEAPAPDSPPEKKAAMRRKAFSKRADDDDSNWADQFEAEDSEDDDSEKKESRRKGRRRTAEDNLDVAKKDTDSKNVEAPNTDTSDRAQQTQYDRGEYDQNGPLLTDPDESTDQNWPPKSSAVDAIRLADVYVDLGLIEPEQKYQVVAGFEKMNSYIVKDRLKVLTAVAAKVKKAAPQRNRSMVPQSSNGTNKSALPSMGRGSSLNGHNNDDISAHFLAL